jgi:hypothetical protein
VTTSSASSARADATLARTQRRRSPWTTAIAAGGLATLVALVEDWRAGAHVGEAILELDHERRILRTET